MITFCTWILFLRLSFSVFSIFFLSKVKCIYLLLVCLKNFHLSFDEKERRNQKIAFSASCYSVFGWNSCDTFFFGVIEWKREFFFFCKAIYIAGCRCFFATRDVSFSLSFCILLHFWMSFSRFFLCSVWNKKVVSEEVFFWMIIAFFPLGFNDFAVIYCWFC